MPDDFCLIHGLDHMRCEKVWGAIPYCEACDSGDVKLFGDEGVFERPSDLQKSCPQCKGVGWIDCYPVAETCTLCNGSKLALTQGQR